MVVDAGYWDLDRASWEYSCRVGSVIPETRDGTFSKDTRFSRYVERKFYEFELRFATPRNTSTRKGQ